MPEPTAPAVITGMGIVNSVAADVAGFDHALRKGRCGIGTLDIPGADEMPVGVAAQVPATLWADCLARYATIMPEAWQRARKVLRNHTASTRLSVCAAFEALHSSGVLNAAIPRERIGIIVAGSNLHQGYVWDNALRFQRGGGHINPRYAVSYLDSSQVGALGEVFGMLGMGYSLGGASASGNLALLHARQWLACGLLDACLVVGASSELSPLELQGFAVLGAASGRRYRDAPTQACRPFDRDRDGFVWGQGCGVLVLETAAAARARNAPVVGRLTGATVVMDGNHLTDPRLAGEVAAMTGALADAGIGPADVGYVNAHGTASALGDSVECAALHAVFDADNPRVPVNSTKSLIGHGLGAAGVMEAIACLLQLKGGYVHPNLNLVEPIDAQLNFAPAQGVLSLTGAVALSNGFGFGGINTSIVLQRGDD